MWSLWLIVGVAVAGAVTLTVSGVVIAVAFERKRHRKLMAEHNIDRSLSQYHRPHLSITDIDFSSLPRPARSLRQSLQRPRSESSRFYASCPAQDEIRAFPEGMLMDSVVHPGWTSAESSYQWLSPSKKSKSKRKKKVPKLSVSAPVLKSRLSAVTEGSEGTRQGTPEPVELPTNVTPRVTPEKAPEICSAEQLPSSVKAYHTQKSVDSILITPADKLGSHMPQNLSHSTALRSRSISMGRIVAPPPDVPLPEMPAHSSIAHGRDRSSSRSKSSDFGKHRRELPLVSPTLTTTQTNQLGRISGLSNFEFGLIEGNAKMPKARSGVPSLYIRTDSSALQQYGQQSLCMPHNSSTANAPNGDFKTIDASNWNIPRGLGSFGSTTPTKSQNNYESGSRSLSTSGNNDTFTTTKSVSSSPLKNLNGISARPISITSVDMFRLSVIGTSSPDSPRRGHKRQNCVRIKNLQPADAKKRLSSQLDRLAEAEEDSSILLPSPAKKNLYGEMPQSKTSLDIPKVRQPPSLSLRVKRPGLVASKSVHGQRTPLREDGLRSAPPALPANQANLSPRRAQTVAHASRDIELCKSTTPSKAKTPPRSDYTSASSSFLFGSKSPGRQKSKIQGPRGIPPPSLRVRNRSGSPIRCKSSSINKCTTSDADLRKSIALLRSMAASPNVGILEVNLVQSSPPMPVHTPSSRYIQSPEVKKQRKRSNTVAGHADEGFEPGSKHLRQAEARQKGFLETPPATGKFLCSPSNISIWEDASVRADSPDGASGLNSARQSHLYSRPESVTKTCPIKLQKASKMIARFEGIENPRRKGRDADPGMIENVTLRSMREGGRKRSHTTNTHVEPPAVIGLGLRFGERSMAYTVNEMNGQEGSGRLDDRSSCNTSD